MFGLFAIGWAYQLIEQSPHGLLSFAVPTLCRHVTMAFIVAVVLTAVAIRWKDSPAAAAFAWLAVTGIALAVVDIEFQRLPHHLVGAMAIGGGVLLGVADLGALSRGLVAALGIAGCWSLARIVFLDGVGFGDVTLSGAVALYLGWLGWQYLLLALLVTALLAGALAGFLLVTRRAGPKDQFAYGPVLVFSTLLVLVFP
ncbi:prepilin peptidase [Actinocrispum wychmicini]|uniref:prepilin peptidase n=1 Tax=Actinocrispum wychmicini TaxID=1213861 RepID=UPI0014044813|nr:prepilin peptidase [Actinocrispum wychmicini]